MEYIKKIICEVMIGLDDGYNAFVNNGHVSPDSKSATENRNRFKECEKVLELIENQEHSSPCVIESQASIDKENIIIWVARDEAGTLCVFNNKPCRQLTSGEWVSRDDGGIMLNPELCKSVTWDSKPIKVKLVEVKE